MEKMLIERTGRNSSQVAKDAKCCVDIPGRDVRVGKRVLYLLANVSHKHK